MRAKLHPEARAELREAALWYDEQRPGLGVDFIGEVHATRALIEQGPQAFPGWPGARSAARPIRRALVSRFPYALAFEVRQEGVLILAVAHAKRRPLYWLHRSRPA